MTLNKKPRSIVLFTPNAATGIAQTPAAKPNFRVPKNEQTQTHS